MNKTTYVRSQGQTRPHTCHWTGCKTQCPPAMWGCKTHWFMLPLSIRNKIWASYRIGQEVEGNVSNAYYEAAEEAEKYIEQAMNSRAGK